MNILISVNTNYFDKIKTTLYSLALNTKEDLHVYLITSSLPKNKIKQLNFYFKKFCHATLHTIEIENDIFEDFPVGRFSKEMYYRLLAQFLLPKDIDRILWVDADVIIRKDISEFYHQNFDNKLLIACTDIREFLEVDINKQKEKLGLSKEHQYFNSGIIIFNIAELRKQTSMEQICSCAEHLKKSVEYPDQDILNVLYENKVKYEDWKKYNFQTGLWKNISKNIEKDVAIVHYAGLYKPWKYLLIMDISKYYWEIQKKRKRYVRYLFAMGMKTIRKFIFDHIIKEKYTKEFDGEIDYE